MICSLDGLDPPGIAGEVQEHRRLLPELLKLVDERVLQLVERREHGIGEVLTDMPEDLLSGIEFRTVGGQIERIHVLGPAHFAAVMTARTVQHDPDRPLSQLSRADAAGRSPGIGLPRSATTERRLCPWWVPPRHTATTTRSRLARSKGDVPPADTTADAAR